MINKHLVIAGLVASVALVSSCKEDAKKQDDSAKIATIEQKFSYLVGQNITKSLQQNGVTIDNDAFMLAVSDSKAGTPSRISEEDSAKIMQEMQQKAMAKKEEEQKKVSEANIAAGKKFLEENKAKEGVQVTASGLQYKVITAGNGVKPKATDTVSVHYTGKLVNGTEFDSSRKHGDQPVTFPVNGVIPGWTEALQLMPMGSKWELYIPSDLAYGPGGNGPIPPASTLIFEVELLEVKATPAADAKPAAKPAAKK
jgi:FKBP-type peptidyl-prolyl cis-trans isomerase FkpA/FKBP-type peptidyl-prolyl cis-trans isomerase FklB